MTEPLFNALDAKKIDRLKNLMGERFLAFLQTFIDSGETLVAKIVTAFESRDFEIVKTSAHTLKSTCQIGTPELLAAAQTLEQAAKSGDSDVIRPSVNDVRSAYLRAAAEAKAQKTLASLMFS